VRCEADTIKGEAIPGPPAPAAAAASALLTLSITANVGRLALRTIATVLVAVSILPAAGVAALPLPPRKTQKTPHQEQIARQNERKQMAVHAQAHARATTLIAKERAKEKENRRMTAEVIEETEVSLDGSKTNAGGRPAVSFHDPHFLLTQRPAAKSSLSCTGIFGSNAAGECVPIHWQLPTALTTEDRFGSTSSAMFPAHVAGLAAKRRGCGRAGSA